MPHLNGAACADLQWALLADLAPALHGAEGDLFVFHTPSGPQEAFHRLRKLLDPAVYLPQQGNDLGRRMHLAFTRIFRQGYDRCLLLGSDIPFVSGEDLAAAWQALNQHDAVLGPSRDGGYWLVGLKKPFPPLFLQQQYGHGNVLAQALALCAAHGISAGTTTSKRDLDTWEDLCYFRRIAERESSPRLFAFMQKRFA